MGVFINASFGQATEVVHAHQSFSCSKFHDKSYLRYNYLIMRAMSYNSQSISEVEGAPDGSRLPIPPLPFLIMAANSP